MITQPSPWLLICKSFCNNDRNQYQLSWFSPSTIAHAIGYIWLFGSLPIAHNIWPLTAPFRKHPSSPTTLLQPARKPLLQPSRQTYILSNIGLSVTSGFKVTATLLP